MLGKSSTYLISRVIVINKVKFEHSPKKEPIANRARNFRIIVGNHHGTCLLAQPPRCQIKITRVPSVSQFSSQVTRVSNFAVSSDPEHYAPSFPWLTIVWRKISGVIVSARNCERWNIKSSSERRRVHR